MRQNQTRQKLLAGECVYGLFQDFASPVVTEIAGLCGVDFVICDAEHGPLELRDVGEMIRAAEGMSITPIVRIAQNEQQVILRYFDLGAQGCHLPLINSGPDARRAADSVKYPPVGKRGLASPRATDYGLTTSLADYVEQANRETLLITHIETVEAVGNLAEILAVEPIDVIFLGPTDLSSALGVPGRRREPIVLETMQRVVDQTLAAGKIVGTLAVDADWVHYWRERGIRYFAGGVGPVLARGIRQFLSDARA